jgi:hypothetical protein
MEPMKSLANDAALAWVRRFAIALVAFIAFIPILFTVLELFQAGPTGWAELGFASLAYAWPTVLALALVIGEPYLFGALHWRPRSALVATIAWLGSTLAYAPDFPSVSVRDTIATLILAGSPILAVYTSRLILARTSLRPAIQLGATIVTALLLVSLTGPMALVVGCAVTGTCP